MAKKKSKPILKNLEEVNNCLLELAQQKAYVLKKEAKLNQEIDALKKQTDTVTLGSRTKIKQLELQLKDYAENNKKDFEKRRSVKLLHGIIGFRKGTPALKLLNRKFNWDSVTDLLQTMFKGKYIKRTPVPMKDNILQDYSQAKLTNEQLAEAGLRVDQDEKFFYDVDWEKLDKIN